jgi:hypothetical protein
VRSTGIGHALDEGRQADKVDNQQQIWLKKMFITSIIRSLLLSGKLASNDRPS